jgi:hypothetical protein
MRNVVAIRRSKSLIVVGDLDCDLVAIVMEDKYTDIVLVCLPHHLQDMPGPLRNVHRYQTITIVIIVYGQL